MLLFDHLTLAAFIHSLALSLLHTAYVPQTKKMRSTRQRVYGKSQSSDFIACLRSAKASLSCSMECGTVTRVAPSASVSTLPSPHSTTTHTKQPTRCSQLSQPNEPNSARGFVFSKLRDTRANRAPESTRPDPKPKAAPQPKRKPQPQQRVVRFEVHEVHERRESV